MSETVKGYSFGISAALIWCGFILVSRMGGVSDLSSFDVIAIRYLTCASILLPVWLYFKFSNSKHRFNLLDPKLIMASVVGGLAYALFTFKGFEMAPASHAAVLLPGLIPLLIIALTVMVNKERQGLGKWLGMGVIALGIGMLFYRELSQGQGITQGHIYLALGALCWAIFTVLIKRWNISAWQATVSLAVVTCVLYMPVYVLWLPKNISLNVMPDIALQAVYQGVMATIIQMFLYVRAVQILGPASMGSLMAIVPVLSGVAALFVFNEPASKELVVGLMLVSLGAWLAHSKWLGSATGWPRTSAPRAR